MHCSTAIPATLPCGAMKPEDETPGEAQGMSTRAVHAGGVRPHPGAPVVTPIYQTSTFFSDPVPIGEVQYTRYGNNPNHVALGEKLAVLDGGEAALVVASGNAACALSLLACAAAGDHIIAQRELYGGTLRLVQHELPRLGMACTLLPDGTGWANAITPQTRALLLEMPVNPTVRVPDLHEAVQAARPLGIPVIVDATFASPINFRPLEHGADIVFHSATKYLGGHSDLSAGVVISSAARIEQIRGLLKSFGPVLDPHAVWLLERGVKTLAVRMERHNQNGFAVARWLEQHPAVARVFYPALESHPDHERAQMLFTGCGGVLSIMVRGGDEAALRVTQRLRLMCVAPSLGGVDTLVSMPRFTSHAALSSAERHALGIGDGFIRLALGIEDTHDLIADLDQALAPEAGAADEPVAQLH
jgi:cystathionine beta-lyase/cystathionine gamma-synthase